MQNPPLIRLIRCFLFLPLLLLAAGTWAQSQIIKYNYDELGRLVVVDDSTNGNREYFYDAAGNRTQVNAVGIVLVAMPTISPNGGTYTGSVTVSLTTVTAGATIRYTTNGSNVTSSSPVYTNPFPVASSSTVKAKAYKTGGIDSPQASATFTLTPLVVAKPSITPNGGNFAVPIPVSLATSTTGASIRYTTNSADVTETSPLYSGEFTVSATTTIKARAFKANMTGSAQEEKTFVFPSQAVAAPSISPNGGSHTESVNVSIACSTNGAIIRYTTNGSEVTSSSPVYSSSFSITSNTTVKARAYKAGLIDSPQVVTPPFVILVAKPSITPGGGSHVGSVSVSLATSTNGASIRYTTNNLDVTEASPLYSGPLNLTTNTWLKARAFKAGMTGSTQEDKYFTIELLAAPTGLSVRGPFSPYGGGYNYSWNSVEGATHYKVQMADGTLRTFTTLWADSAGPRPEWIRAVNSTGMSHKAFFPQ